MSDLEMALRLYDRHFYGQAFGVGKAQDYLKKCGFDAKRKDIRKAAKECCEFFLKEPVTHIRRKARRHSFGGDEWYKMIGWIRSHDIDLWKDTIDSVLMRMRLSGMCVNYHAVKEALISEGINLDGNPKLKECAA
jgi:hypothetical protein